ncbi:MAG TPA: acetylxylan esterase [Chitinophagaceae bacterium]|nr:acetylxylan esterase [Chitinophagaceae bacterium]
MRAIVLLMLFTTMVAMGTAQTSDDQFRKPLKEVLLQVEKRYGVTLRYPEELVNDKWVTYADWRFRPDVEKTLANILATQDISFSRDGEKRFKLQHFQYHLKTVEDGKLQLQYLATLHNDLAGWEKRKSALKECFLSALKLTKIPAWPSGAPIITPQRKMDGYTVENIALETLPGLYVCGSLYKPAQSKGKMPLVLNPDGHFAKGRYREDCQYRCAMLARMGAMAFSYDLFAWDGESLLQVEPGDHRRSLAQSIQALNALRIMDYLLSRKDVDTSRVAITGASGGGSQAMLLTALDNRIKLSVPVVMMSSYHSGGCPCESGMGIHVCLDGTNNVEIASMAAPRPQLIVSDGKDWTQHVPQNEFPFLQSIYNYYNEAGKVKNVHLDTEGHDYGLNKRKAMYEFIAQYFGLDIKKIQDAQGNIDESKVTIEKESNLFVFGEKGEKLPANALKGFEAITKAFEQAVR